MDSCSSLTDQVKEVEKAQFINISNENGDLTDRTDWKENVKALLNLIT
jgi:hypothetical protein